MKGSYILLIKLPKERNLSVGKLGYINFPEAFYAYVGSAMNGFKVRLAHHLREKKKPHWHIDYLLNEAEVLEIILCPSEPFAFRHSDPEWSEGAESRSALRSLRGECFIAHALAKEFQSIPCFGASDCKCDSHLYFANDKDRLRAKVIEAIDQPVVSYEPKAWQSHSQRRLENGIGI